MLFILSVEFMANKIQNAYAIKPICIDNYNVNLKHLQYADDTLFFVHDESSLQEILKELEIFGKLAGPKLNKEKTVMMWIGDTSKPKCGNSDRQSECDRVRQSERE